MEESIKKKGTLIVKIDCGKQNFARGISGHEDSRRLWSSCLVEIRGQQTFETCRKFSFPFPEGVSLTWFMHLGSLEDSIFHQRYSNYKKCQDMKITQKYLKIKSFSLLYII